MRTKILLMALIAFIMTALTGCSDFLDIEKKGNLGAVEDFYKTDEDAEQAIATVYSSWGGQHYNLFMMCNMLSDDCWAGGGSKGDNPGFQNLNEYSFGTDNGAVESSFSGLYGVNYNANLVISKVNPDTPVKKRCVAEAYFFRGWANLYLAMLWGTAPVVDHLLDPSEYAAANSKEGELLEFAINNFKQAIEMNVLPSKTSKEDNQTSVRVTKEAAYAFYGKALLFAGRNDEAAEALDVVINSGLYGLYAGDYGDMFKENTEFGIESILENNQPDDNNTSWSFQNYVSVMRGWRNDMLTWSNIKDSYRQNIGGYGFENPRKQLYDDFKAWNAKGGGDDYRLDQTIKTYDFVRNQMGLSVTNTLHGHEGYWSWKFRCLEEDLVQSMGGWNVLVKTNWRYMRYAEVLLLAAEANLTADNAKATRYINEVRTRAHLTPLGGVTLDDIKNEKRFELCFEGCRYIDLVRWGDAYEILKNQGKTVMCFDGTTAKEEYTNSKGGFVQGRHELLPIPAKERLLNSNIEQNPGWAAVSEEEL